MRRSPRPRRALRSSLPLSSWTLNGAAIGIAVLLTPALTGSATSSAAIGGPIATRPSITTPAQVTTPAPLPSSERFAGQLPQDGPDRNAQREAMDFDDTLPPPPPPGASVTSNGSEFVSPVPGGISGGFGQRFHPILHYWRMHNGVDMTAGCGTVVIAAYRGTVVQAGPSGGYGNLIVIDHGSYKGKHVISKYAHLSRIGVRLGQRVETGHGIALAGTTGLSTGCHLHFEIKENGVYVDPAPYLTGKPSPRPPGPVENLGPTTSPSPTPSATTTPKPSPTPTKPSHTPKPSPTATPKPSTSPTPSASGTPSPTPTPTPTESERTTPSPSPSETENTSPSPSPSKSERTSPTPSPSKSERTSPTPSPSKSERTTPTPSPSESEAERPKASPSGSATP